MSMQVGVGASRESNTIQAGREAVRLALGQCGAALPTWALVFFTPPHLAQVAALRQALLEELPGIPWAGCCGAGVLTQQDEILGSPGVVVMVAVTPAMQALAFAKRQESRDSPSVLQQLRESLSAFTVSNQVVLIFPDAYQQQPYNLINMFNYLPTHPLVFGAGSADDGSLRRSAQMAHEGLVQGLAGLALGGDFQLEMGITQSCRPVGDPMFITQVEENTIVTLDGFPALEVFTTLASNLDLPDLQTAAQQLLIGFPLSLEQPEFTGEGCLVRHLSGIDVQNRGLQVPHIIQEGGILSFLYRSPATAQQDLYTMLERIQEKNPATPAFGIYFNCAARGPGFYGQFNVDSQAIQDTLGKFPLIGFFGSFEMASVPQGLQLYSYTGILVLFYAR